MKSGTEERREILINERDWSLTQGAQEALVF
jgi:hypothetical protein